MNTATLASSRTGSAPFHIAPPAGLLSLLKRAEGAAAPAVAAVRELEAGAIVGIARPLGRTIYCAAGTLWLTFDNEAQDVIVEAGQSHRCAKSSKLLIQAMVNSRLSVD